MQGFREGGERGSREEESEVSKGGMRRRKTYSEGRGDEEEGIEGRRRGGVKRADGEEVGS